MESELISGLSDVTRLIRRAFDARARQIGVTRPQWQVMTQIKRHAGINQGALAELLDVEPITVARMIDRLEESGIVERRSDPADRRAWRLHLTEKAEGLIDQLRPLAADLFDEAFDGLSTEERTTLFTLVEKIRGNFSARPPEGLVAHG
jgi:DNA-binding MarR family transcriptional regulator